MIRNLLLLCALVVATGPVLAATPESGVITDSQHTLEWTGGPYIVPNLTPATGQPLCEEGTPACDVFRFEVNLSNANLDDDTVVVTVAWASFPPLPTDAVAVLPDYDLYLYDDETGALLRTQATAANPEIIILDAQNRKYRLDVIPFAAMNEPYTGKVQFVKFEEEKNQALAFFGGAFGAGTLIVLAGFGAMLRKTLPVLALLVAGTAGAATPESGKISHEQPAAEWSGELLTPNPGGSGVPVICEEGTPTCDVYRFEADLPDANLDDDLIVIRLEWSDPTGQMDIDMYIYDETTGEEVGAGTAFGGGAETVFIPARSGKYRVDVIPWAAAAQSYTGVVKFEPFEEEGKNSLLGAGALGLPGLLALAGFAALVRRRRKS